MAGWRRGGPRDGDSDGIARHDVWWRSRWLRVAALVGGALPLLVGAALPGGAPDAGVVARRHAPTPAHGGAAAQALVTSPAYTVPRAMVQRASIDLAFQAYYDANAGAQLLGRPITPALPTERGLVQYFEGGALLLMADLGTPGLPRRPDGIAAGATAHIAELPLLDELLRLGSTAPIGESASLTYLDLRRALQAPAAHLGPATTIMAANTEAPGQVGGHPIPQAIWQYITRPDVSPHGWEQRFGAPRTNPLPLTSANGDTLHRGWAQVFEDGVLIEEDAANGEATVRPADVGRAYLETVGLPAIALAPGDPLWAARDTALMSAAVGGAAQAHVGEHFRLTLTGRWRWVDGALWYEVTWRGASGVATGWIAATDATLTAPAAGAPVWAGFDVLSPALQAYLDHLGQRVGAVVYDPRSNTYYAYNTHGQFTVASSVKVPIMLAFLTMTERQGREPNDQEMSLLTTMIENSNNDSAQALWDEIGGGPALGDFMRSVGIGEFSPNPDAWGWSTIAPVSMVRLLTLLHDGTILTAQDRQLALYLMQHIEADEQNGVGDTAPPGATVAMKDGWVPGPDGMWAMNTSGIVTIGPETYIISVYTKDDDSLDDGWDITRHVCATVAAALS